MKTTTLVTVIVALFSSSAYSFEETIRKQVIKSKSFISFKAERFKRLRKSKTDNTYIQCLKDEHQRITAPRPKFGDYYQIRHPEYTLRSSKHTINKTEACIEYAYESEHCSAHHDQSINCDGNVFARVGQVTPESKAISGNAILKDSSASSADKSSANGATGH